MPKKQTIMQVASNENFRLAKACLDETIIDAVEEFRKATPECRIKGIDIFMNGEEDGCYEEIGDTVNKV